MYTWLTFLQARIQLAQRLADPTNAFWTDDELKLYITEALRTFNALTATWTSEFTFNAPISANQIWYDLSQLAGSPRLRTVTDADVYLQMRYHLLEPPTGSLTSQFTQADLTGALQRRRDEIIQGSNCNLRQITTASTPGLRRTFLPDTVFEVPRARFIPVPLFGPPVTLWRDSNLAFEMFEPQFQQLQQGLPQAYDVVSVPPLALDVDVVPNSAGSYDLITLQSGVSLDPFDPLNPKVIGLPDDFAWVAKWGALADLLGRESEATDRARASFCLQRYMDGLKLLAGAPWLLLGYLNGIPVDTMGLTEMDAFAPEWDSDAGACEGIVLAGTDFFAVSPVPTSPQTGVFLTVVGNAPVPALDGDFVQVSRDAWDSILSYAQFLATFKMGGADFSQAKDLEQEFVTYCAGQNKHLLKMGLYSDILRAEGRRQEREEERA